jgi:hypothetical protein
VSPHQNLPFYLHTPLLLQQVLTLLPGRILQSCVQLPNLVIIFCQRL